MLRDGFRPLAIIVLALAAGIWCHDAAVPGGMHMVRRAEAQPSGKPRQPTEATNAFQDAMTQLQLDMSVDYGQSADPDFAALLAAQGKALLAVSAIELKHGTDPKLRALAEQIRARTEADLATITAWQRAHKDH